MKSEEQSQRSNSSPAAWERWVLSLDKYIDPNDQPKKHRYALMVGFSLCIASYLLLLSIGLSNSNSLVLLVVIFLVEPVFGSFDEAGWRSDRFFKYIKEKNEREKHLSFMERYNKKTDAKSYCDRKNLHPFPEKGWLKTRFLEHYICTIYEIRSAAFVGWLIATVLLLVLVWLFNLLTK